MRRDELVAFFRGLADAALLVSGLAAAARLGVGLRRLVAPGRSSGSRAAATDSSTRRTPAAAEVRFAAACRRAEDRASSSLTRAA